MEKPGLSRGKIYLVGLAAIIVILAVGIGLLSQRTFLERQPIPAPTATRLKVPAAPPVPPSDAIGSGSAGSADLFELEDPSSSLDTEQSHQLDQARKDALAPAVSLGVTSAMSAHADTVWAEVDADLPATRRPSSETTSDKLADEKEAALPAPHQATASTSAGNRFGGRQEAAKHSFYSIQVGAFQSERNAQKKAEQMRQEGYDAFITPIGGGTSGTLLAVRFGRFATQSLARESLVEFSEKEEDVAIIIRMKESDDELEEIFDDDKSENQ